MKKTYISQEQSFLLTQRLLNKIEAIIILFISMITSPIMLIYSLKNQSMFLNRFSWVLILINSFVLLFFFLYIKYKYLNINNYFKEQKIIRYIENNLISIGCYKETFKKNIVITPNIIVKPREITIYLHDLKDREILESFQDSLSTALPSSYVVESVNISRDNTRIEIEYHDIDKDKRLIFNSFDDYKNFILKNTDNNQIFITNNRVIDLRITPHGLYTGFSGSGKSYGLTATALLQGIIKNWNITIIDIKGGLVGFSKFTNFISEKNSIISALENVCSEIDSRKEQMKNILSDNPNAIASEHGIKTHLLIIDEYSAMINSFDNKEQKHINSLIKKIVLAGRSLSIHCLICTQVSDAQDLDSAIRAQCTYKLCFGASDETTLKTTFGLSAQLPKILYKLERGEGYGSIQNQIFTFAIPTINYKISDLVL